MRLGVKGLGDSKGLKGLGTSKKSFSVSLQKKRAPKLCKWCLKCTGQEAEKSTYAVPPRSMSTSNAGVSWNMTFCIITSA